MTKLQTLSSSCLEREEYKDVQKLFSSLDKNIAEFEQEKIKIWEKEVESSSKDKLKESLLMRTPEGRLKLNFDPALVRLLKEVKYKLQLGIVVPPSAQEIYSKASI